MIAWPVAQRMLIIGSCLPADQLGGAVPAGLGNTANRGIDWRLSSGLQEDRERNASSRD